MIFNQTNLLIKKIKLKTCTKKKENYPDTKGRKKQKSSNLLSKKSHRVANQIHETSEVERREFFETPKLLKTSTTPTPALLEKSISIPDSMKNFTKKSDLIQNITPLKPNSCEVSTEIEQENETVQMTPSKKPIKVRFISPVHPKIHYHTQKETLTVSRRKSIKVNGIRLYYQLMRNENIILFAKMKSVNSEEVLIQNGNQAHLGDFSAAKIQISDQGHQYKLIQNEESIFDLHFCDTGQVKVIFFHNRNLPVSLISATQFATPLSPNSFKVESMKNFDLMIEMQNKVLIRSRKITKNKVEIDTLLEIPDIVLFGLGICAFLRKPHQAIE